jgi:hypothetical protein
MINRYNLKMVTQVALPRIKESTILNMLGWHDENKKILANKGAAALHYPWLASTIRDIDPLDNPVDLPGIPGSMWNKYFVDAFPEVCDAINRLPLISIDRVYLLENRVRCQAHNDLSKFLYAENLLEPCSYRMTLRSSTSTKGFYVQPKPTNEWGQKDARHGQGWAKDYWEAAIGSWWVLNNFVCQHGADWAPGDDKVILSVQGTPNADAHKMLMRESVDYNGLWHPIAHEILQLDSDERKDLLDEVNGAFGK